MPRLGSVHAQLAALAGTWEGAEQLAPSPWSPGGAAHGRHRFAVTAGGFALVQDYTEQRDGVEALSGHGVFTADPGTDDVLWFWFDSIGFPPAAPARGSFDGDGHLMLVKQTQRGTQRALFALDGDHLRHRIEVRLTGADVFATLVEGDYERTGAAAPARAIAPATASAVAPASANASRTST